MFVELAPGASPSTKNISVSSAGVRAGAASASKVSVRAAARHARAGRCADRTGRDESGCGGVGIVTSGGGVRQDQSSAGPTT
jgi:hypothetical protein